MKKQQQSQNKVSQKQNTTIPTVRYHPTIQIHIAGVGTAVHTSGRPSAKLSPPTENRKMVQHNQDSDKNIPGSAAGPRAAGEKKKEQCLVTHHAAKFDTMKKQQQSHNEVSQKQNTTIPTVRYHPTIQIHTAGYGPAVHTSSRPSAKPSPPTENRKMVQHNQDSDKNIPGSAARPRPAGGKKKEQVNSKLAPRAVRDPSPPPGPELGQTLCGQKVLPGDAEVQMDRCTIGKVEVQTRGQRTNPEWFAWRKNRITASIAHSIAHSRFANGTSKTPPTSYLAAVTGESKRVQTRAMSWGIHKEKEAVQKYQDWKSASLRRPVSVQECGLFIDAQRHWLAASPDGIVIDRHTGQRLLCLEVKCPYKHRHRKVDEACREDPSFCLKILEQDGETPVQETTYSLKTSHSYYTQIQCQLAVTGLQRADFVIYTMKELAVVPVTFDPEMWNETVSKLQLFYNDAVLPHLIAKTHSSEGAVWKPEL